MSTTAANVEQVIELARKLTPRDQDRVLDELSRSRIARRWQEPSPQLQQRVRELAAERGRDLDKMNDDELLDFIDDLLHEDD